MKIEDLRYIRIPVGVGVQLLGHTTQTAAEAWLKENNFRQVQQNDWRPQHPEQKIIIKGGIRNEVEDTIDSSRPTMICQFHGTLEASFCPTLVAVETE